MALKWTNKAQGALNSSADRKLRISSLTKAIGLASVFGAATALSPAAQALKTDFGVEYRATGFYAQSDAFDTNTDFTSDEDNGFAHLIRLKSDFLDEDTGISLHTSVELAGDRWVAATLPRLIGLLTAPTRATTCAWIWATFKCRSVTPCCAWAVRPPATTTASWSVTTAATASC